MITYAEYCANPVDFDLWGKPDDEVISHHDIRAAIEAAIEDATWPGDLPADEDESIVVAGFNRRSARGFLDGSLLAMALERLDEEFGEPYGVDDPTAPSDAMRAAEAAFIEAILAEYPVWQCDQVVEVTVPILAWVREHRPDWLNDEGDAA